MIVRALFPVSYGPQRPRNLPGRLLGRLSSVGVSVLIPLTANVACTPHRAPADLAFGGSGHADTINSYPTRAALLRGLA